MMASLTLISNVTRKTGDSTILDIVRIFAIFIIAVSITCVAWADYIYVSNDTVGPWDGTSENPYNSIQDGVDNARDGDIIIVSDGIYIENIEIRDKNGLTIRSAEEQTATEPEAVIEEDNADMAEDTTAVE